MSKVNYMGMPEVPFMDNEITIEDEPPPVGSATHRAVTAAKAVAAAAKADTADRFRITTNGEKFRVEESVKRSPPLPIPGYKDPEEWQWVHVGGPGCAYAIAVGWEGYETEPQAVHAKAERIKVAEIAARPWVPVEEGS